MDSHFSTHAGKQREALVIINKDDHRDALAHFGEVAAAVVLRWKQRKCTGCCAYNLIDMTCERSTAVGIHMNIDKLPTVDVTDGAFIHVGGDLDTAWIALLGYGYAGTNCLTYSSGNLHDDTSDRG